jgi:polyhydroxybutyrate depolymerase
MPIVFELHGGGVYIEDMTGESGHKTPFKLWMELAERDKFIVVYPEGLNGAYGKPTWNDCRGDCQVSSDANDVQFIDTLIENLSADFDIDTHRIYISGLSNGGFMAQRIGIELNHKIAAISSVVASKPAVSTCANPQPMSVLFMFGTDDNHMPYNGGLLSNPPNALHGTVLSADATIDYWKNFNQTDITPQYEIFPDLDANDGGIVEKFSYLHGVNETEVIIYKINGAGHAAPSIRERYSSLFEQYFNKQNHDIEMTTEVWNFFKNKTL